MSLKVHGSCRDMSLKSKSINLRVALEIKVRSLPKSVDFIPLAPQMSVVKIRQKKKQTPWDLSTFYRQ